MVHDERKVIVGARLVFHDMADEDRISANISKGTLSFALVDRSEKNYITMTIARIQMSISCTSSSKCVFEAEWKI